ncbi:hypothetical protein HYX05_00845 [Candidatus Woesearchaeota archaeon]|nr:hypothetical protein [Candidatus Woesearchaeota archaeon]
MKIKTAILLVLVFSVFLAGCTSSNTDGYATYNQPQQGQYVGGGCGVAPNAAYEDTPVGYLDAKNSQL